MSLKLRDARYIAVWVDENVGATDIKNMQEAAKELVPSLEIVSVVSSGELRTWLRKFGSEVTSKLRVVCSSYCAGDGGSSSTWRVINEVRKVAKLKKVPIMVYKSKGATFEPSHFSKMNMIYYPKTQDEVKAFMINGKT